MNSEQIETVSSLVDVIKIPDKPTAKPYYLQEDSNGEHIHRFKYLFRARVEPRRYCLCGLEYKLTLIELEEFASQCEESVKYHLEDYEANQDDRLQNYYLHQANLALAQSRYLQALIYQQECKEDLKVINSLDPYKSDQEQLDKFGIKPEKAQNTEQLSFDVNLTPTPPTTKSVTPKKTKSAVESKPSKSSKTTAEESVKKPSPGRVEPRKVKGKYIQYYYHWEEWDNGNCQKRSKYIPKRLLELIENASRDKLPVAEILKMLAEKKDQGKNKKSS